jgi:hypothetical protein
VVDLNEKIPMPEPQNKQTPNEEQSVVPKPLSAYEPHLWHLHGFVLFFVVLGLFVVLLAEFYASTPAWKDVGLIVGGILIGFVALSVDELIRARPERRRAKEQTAKEREADRRQHKEEIKNDLEKFLALESQLHESKRRETELQAQLEVVMAQERRHIYDALWLGYVHHQPHEQLGVRGPIFANIASKLDLPADLVEEKHYQNLEEYSVFMTRIFDALERKFGPAVVAACELGAFLGNLNAIGFKAMFHPNADSLEYVQTRLRLLKCDQEIIWAVGRFWDACKTMGSVPNEASKFFEILLELVSGRFREIPRSSAENDSMRHFIENPIRVPKTVRVENAKPPEKGEWLWFLVCGRPIMVKNNGDSFFAMDWDDRPERRWTGNVCLVRGYKVRQESGALIFERNWGYPDERPPGDFINISIDPPSNPRDREPKEQFVPNVAPPPVGGNINVPLGDRQIAVFNPDGRLHGFDIRNLWEGFWKTELLVVSAEGQPLGERVESRNTNFEPYLEWDVRVKNGGLQFSRFWRYNDEPPSPGSSQ